MWGWNRNALSRSPPRKDLLTRYRQQKLFCSSESASAIENYLLMSRLSTGSLYPVTEWGPGICLVWDILRGSPCSRALALLNLSLSFHCWSLINILYSRFCWDKFLRAKMTCLALVSKINNSNKTLWAILGLEEKGSLVF